MQISKKFALSLAIVLFCSIITAFLPVYSNQAESAGLWDSQVGMGNSGGEIGSAFGQSGTPRDIRVVLGRLIRVFLGFLGIIFLILLVVAGAKWMMAGGNEKNIDDAKAQIKTAIIGLIIILISYSIASFVTTCIFEVSTEVWYCDF